MRDFNGDGNADLAMADDKTARTARTPPWRDRPLETLGNAVKSFTMSFFYLSYLTNATARRQ
jgi:hypothetical protein